MISYQRFIATISI